MFLGIDCSGVVAELALITPDSEYVVREDTPRQADVIFPLLEKLLAEAKIEMENITAIGAITGPGSFTGIRVGLSLAQGLADGLAVPAYGLSGFAALNSEKREARGEIRVLESKRAELYVQHDDKVEMLAMDRILQLAGTDKKIIHNLENNSRLSTPASHLSSAAAHHAKESFQQKLKGEVLQPYYVRDADAKPAVT